MATSFRLDDELEALLQYAVKRTGQKRSQLIREALSKYCADIVGDTKSTPYERLLASKFRPIEDTDVANLASNRSERRRRLAKRAKADHR